MKRVIVLNSKIHYDDTYRTKRTYNVIKEYPKYYLCECVQDGKSLYKECFLKIYVDEVKKVRKPIGPRLGGCR